ncbi:alpha-2-macroglobulin family protein [Maribacter sp. 2-571]|uniref:alpha-2-macroglobulin family protein n=1 Tax=Maribacter sp. 2-571 TaxID=3417569 RepID=UPI003D335E1A
MKYLAPIIAIFLFSQMTKAQDKNTPYESLWKQVVQAEDQRLTKSALETVRTISKKAKKQKNTEQTVKALLYASKYMMVLEEDAQLQIINDFKTEIANAVFPTKNILESYLANLYWQYYKQNQYRFYQRTQTERKVDSVDFRTWDLNTLFQEISLHFDRSLEHRSRLQKTKLSDFTLLLEEREDSKKYRPTLFDLLAHTALDFYKSSENSITRPADKFEINDTDLLCDAGMFTQRTIPTDDRTSLHAKALRLYQHLLRLHLSSDQPYALAEIDLERLQFVYANAIFEGKDNQYLEVLENSVSANKDTPGSTLYQHAIAAFYVVQGNQYNPKSNEGVRWKLKEAIERCNTVIEKFPDARGAQMCRALKSQLLRKNMQLTSERYLPTEQTGKLLVNYKNHTGLKLSACKITKGQQKKLNGLYPNEKQLAYIRELPVSQRWETALTDENDYQNHTTEIRMPPLKNGRYLILAEPLQKDGTPVDDGTFAFNTAQVTNIALLPTTVQDEHLFQMVDRNNGKPLSGAGATLSYQVNYDGPYLKKTMTADANGFIRIPLQLRKYWNNVTIAVAHGKETAHFGDYYINEKYEQSEVKVNYHAFLFTDRSIYRPGQPLYFKAIALQKNEAGSSALENTEITITLKDVNYQEVAKQTFRTNAYGSLAGEFILPAGGLTGSFSLEATAKKYAMFGNASISVEEYKRPKFQTNFEPVTETYQVNDSISVFGKAMAYAGSNITDAKVAYTVKRVVSYPRWYSWFRPYVSGNEQEIAHGETVSDASGRYEVRFKAIPDERISRKDLPTFSYEITADVTDLNGETHSATSVVHVGYHTLNANIYVPGNINKDEPQELNIGTTNLNGQFVPAKGTIKVYKLKAPDNVLRSRPWPAPDYQAFDREAFKTLYPHEAYGNEDDSSTWKIGEMVYETGFDTGKKKTLNLADMKKWRSGKYRIILESKDRLGQAVKDISETNLSSPQDQTLPDNQLFSIRTDKQSYSAGEKAVITLASSAKDVKVTLFVEKDRKIVTTKIITLDNNSKSITVPVLWEDQGGFGVSYSLAAYNAFRNGSISISVPYPQTDLTIETTTFRDKLKPGTHETWSFKVKGPEGERISAELLAGMYDASLDAFRGHYWSFDPDYRPSYYTSVHTQGYSSFGTQAFQAYNPARNLISYQTQHFDTFNWFGFYFGNGNTYRTRHSRMIKSAPVGSTIDAMEMDVSEAEASPAAMEDSAGAPPPIAEKRKENKAPEIENNATEQQTTGSEEVQVRTNLQETAFFFPQLQTDKDGSVSFNFRTPEALTEWKLQLLAHTKTMQSGYTTLRTVTQKELMVVPNAPRFLREGDRIIVSTKIANLTDAVLNGEASLQLVDAVSGKDVSNTLLTDKGLKNTVRGFEVDSVGNTQVSWQLRIPDGLQALQYRIIAKAGDFSDGEQNMLPVLSNRMLVTETLPMWVRSNENRSFVMDKLANNSSNTLRNHQLTLEVTSNPAWYAVQALPYLMEYPYECNEQTFSRYYANALATYIANSNPRIQQVFEQWRSSDALLSDLEKNQEMKSLLIQETPWLRDAQSESEQKKRIGLLFDLNKMKQEQASTLRKLRTNQKSNGAWAWFQGGPDSRYITQHIVSGMGHLKQLIASDKASVFDGEQEQMIKKAIAYLDKEFVAEYEYMKAHTDDIDKDHLTHNQIHYLYMRSFFGSVKKSKKVNGIVAYYKGQAQKYWKNKNLYAKGMLALVLHRMEDTATANKILRSLEENSIISEELGMYWKENTASWYWYQAPIETQALLIEAFSEIKQDAATIDNLKIWLLKNKQTKQWKTTKATADAVYALLLQGSDWLSVTDAVEVLVGGTKVDPAILDDVKVAAGTGYFKTAWKGNDITPKMAEVSLKKKGDGIAWGALYWQYFEDLDKITSAETPLSLRKKLFLKKNTATGEQLSAITDEDEVAVGDLIRVRIELRADRNMEFVHMKDMRAAGFEPVNVLSRYRWQDGLGYYESTKDASTNFFFDYLPKGVYVFEYDVRANNAGNFSNGITTIQSMYAPEFSSHSEGVRLRITPDN